MGRIEILEKLNRELEKDIHDECQVIYILSRIRKYLELRNLKQKYKVLNFYCNWALHSKIDRTEPISDILRGFIKNNDDRLLKFDGLPQDLRRFLEENNLSLYIITDIENYLRFANLLVGIYSDTPLEFYLEEKRTIILKKPAHRLTDSVFSVSYEIK